jgi:rubrerythrin
MPEMTDARRIALIQVLGAVAYGELKAHEGLLAEAAATPDGSERELLETFAAQELRHHRGFVARLQALGADPDRAMRPYRKPLDRYHGVNPDDPIEQAIWGYLGEGVADDLLEWLRRVVDADTAAFIGEVIADEEEHEAHATDELRARLDAAGPDARRRAAVAAQHMLVHMLRSGTDAALPMAAFLRLGRPHELLGGLIGGWMRRMRALGLRTSQVLAPQLAYTIR